MGEAKRRGEAGLAPRMKLTCYEISADPINIRPAQPERAWMDASNQGFAYRCLPLVIANAHGWEILSPASFEAYTWPPVVPKYTPQSSSVSTAIASRRTLT